MRSVSGQFRTAIVAIATFIAVGCSTTSDGSVTVEGAHVTVLTHDSFDMDEAVVASFTDRTGIEVQFVPLGDAGTLVNQAVLTKDAPQGDVLFGVDNTFLSRAIDEELFIAYESDRLGVVDESLILDPQHRVTPIDVGDVCLNVDVAWFADHDLPIPGDLADLTDERYRGLLVVQNPATSSPGLAFLLATIERFGTEGYLTFWSQLRDNDVLVTDGWSTAYYEEFTLAGGGERPIVVSYASSPAAEVFFADPQPDVAPTAVAGGTCYRQIEFAGILAGTDQLEASQQVIDFMLSVEFQQAIPLTMWVYPVASDAALPPVFEAHAELPDDVFALDPALVGEQRETWIEAWTTTVLR